MRRYLNLSGGSGNTWYVQYCVTEGWSSREVSRDEVGTVKQVDHGLWSAFDKSGANHGDRYLDRWSAARQLALVLRLELD